MTRQSIVQFWDKNPPDEVRKLMESWRTGPSSQSLEYVRYDDEGAEAFIGESFGERTRRAYCTCAVPAMRADFFRYCYLFRHGGIYVDADIACRRNIDTLCTGLARGLLFARVPRKGRRPVSWWERLNPFRSSPSRGQAATDKPEPGHQQPIRLPNSFMIVMNQEDELLGYALREAIGNIEGRKSNSVWQTTGPGILSRLYNSRSPEATSLFAGFRIAPESELLKFIRFNAPQYKKSELHWTTWQKGKSIYKDM